MVGGVEVVGGKTKIQLVGFVVVVVVDVIVVDGNAGIVVVVSGRLYLELVQVEAMW